MVKVAVVANGLGVIDLQGFDRVIAVDAGLSLLNKKPDLLVGDLDSLDPQLLKSIPSSLIRKFPSDKEKSDTELALEIAYNELNASQVTLFAYFGNRVDHSLYNIYLLKKFPDLLLKNGPETLFLLHGKAKLDLPLGTTVSLIPLSDQVIGVKTDGLKWELKGKALNKSFMSLSNEVLKTPVVISAYAGDLLVCIEEKG